MLNDSIATAGLRSRLCSIFEALNYDLPASSSTALRTHKMRGVCPARRAWAYESLNVGLSSSAVGVGTDVNTDAVYWNTAHGSWYWVVVWAASSDWIRLGLHATSGSVHDLRHAAPMTVRTAPGKTS